jgi:spore photoproduct lyase
LQIFAEHEFATHPLLKGKNPTLVESLPTSVWKDYAKGNLLITRHKGSFLRPCPATPRYNCCGLNIFHFGQGCTMDCSYCVLHSYLKSQALVLFGNIQEGILELDEALTRQEEDPELFSQKLGKGPRSFRYSTGEFTDSLLFDKDTLLSEKLVELFASRKRATLELKTKTSSVGHLLKLKHNGRTVLAFSVNSPQISQAFEHGSAPLEERLEAASAASREGWRLAFHFDPIVHYPGWKEGYQKTIDLIFQEIDPKNIAWISLGTLRYQPRLKTLKKREAPLLFTGEFILGGDGKMRYPRPMRLQIYKTLANSLQKHLDPSTILYLCMESGPVWEGLFGRDPGTNGLTALFS